MTRLRPLDGIAKRVYDDIMRLDPVGAVEYARMVVSGALAHDMEVHQDLIQHRVDEIVTARVATVQKALVRTAVSKARAGGEIDHLEAVNQIIAKAGFGNLTDEDRRRFVQLQGHDPYTGRFKNKTKIIRYNDYAKPYPGRYARTAGIPNPAHLSQRDKAQYHQAYTQVAGLLDEFREAPAGAATVSLLWRTGPSGKIVRTTEALAPDMKPQDIAGFTADKFKGTKEKKLVEAQVIVDGGLDVNGAAFNLVGALSGSPAVAGRVTQGMKVDENGIAPGAAKLGQFADDWDERLAGDTRNPSDRVFRRLSRGSKFLAALGGDALPMQAQMALHAADIAGQYGPEAQKVIGPHADRAAYRYRGVERKPAPGLQGNIDAMVRREGADNARNVMIYGEQREIATRGGVRRDFHESPIVDYFKGRLADENLTDLQRKSGVIPPSEGVIIDRKGKVVTQAVGYGDDWYLPFNLRTLSKLKGGDYIRTRTWGGVTTEDIYTGLISGARSVTVVSHNGVYTVEFDPSLRGSRRYSDKAGRMVKRYGHLLDAVKSKKVTLAEVPADRVKELRDEAAETWDPNRREERARFDTLVGDLIAEEKRNPQMSKVRRRELAEEFLNEQTSHVHTADGTLQTWDVKAADYVKASVDSARSLHEMQFRAAGGDEMAQMLVPRWDEQAAIRSAAARVADPESAINTFGWEKPWSERLMHAEGEYRASQSPLNLDGEGYHKASLALKEQFPYYIANVDYRRNNPGGFDFGYVKPNFNRPEQAQAGYFDETITGHGKVSADETRHQNRGVKVGDVKAKLRPVRTDQTAPATGTSPAAEPTQAANELHQVEAIKRLHEYVNSQQTVNIGGKPYPVGPTQRNELKVLAPNIFTPVQDLFAQNDNDADKVAEKVLADVDRLTAQGAFNVPSTYVNDVRNKGAKSKAPAFNIAHALGNIDQDFDFGDDFAEGRRADQYERLINTLTHQVSKNPDGTDLETLEKKYRIAVDGGRGNIRAADQTRLAGGIERIAKLRQAQRRLADAQAKDQEDAALAQKEERANTDMLVTGSAMELLEAAEEQRRKNQPNDGKTIPYTKREGE